MKQRALGATGIQVGEIGMGCNRLGEDWESTTYWERLVREAVDLGVSFFDTSESYGWGRSEEILGRAISASDNAIVATKVSRIRETAAKDFSAARIIERVEGCLTRLRCDCIDVLQLHSPNLDDLRHFNWQQGFAALKESGKVRFVGVAVNNADELGWLLDHESIDVVQLTYNLLSTEVEPVLERARRCGLGVACRLPLAQGILTGKFSPRQEVPAHHRAHFAGDRMKRWIDEADDLRELAAKYPGGMTRMAHHFSLTPPAISCIISGARNSSQLRENVAASGADLTPEMLTPEMLRRIATVQARWQARR